MLLNLPDQLYSISFLPEQRMGFQCFQEKAILVWLQTQDTNISAIFLP